jgi:hypothetical protein
MKGWHRQYTEIESIDHSFLVNPASLHPFDLERIRVRIAAGENGQTPGNVGNPENEGAAIRGCLDRATTSVISGWAARAHGTDERLTVEIWDGATVVATATADEPRADLEPLGIEGGRAGFTIPTPHELRDGRTHWIWATVAGTALRPSPLVLSAPTRLAVTATGAEAGPPGVG